MQVSMRYFYKCLLVATIFVLPYGIDNDELKSYCLHCFTAIPVILTATTEA
jgi:hypothetical protein